MGELSGKVAIVLGASTTGGMGEAIARRLKAEGATVTVSGLGAEPLQRLARELGGSACEADITEEAQLAGLVSHTMAAHGRLDLSRQGMRNFGADPEAFERSLVELTPLGRLTRPEDIAAFAYVLVRDEFFETGQIFNYSGGNSLLGHPRFLA